LYDIIFEHLIHLGLTKWVQCRKIDIEADGPLGLDLMNIW